MSGALVLVNLIGYVALLLWGTHMVQTGILRAFGSDLRHLLAKGLRNRIAAFLAGLGITAAIQSSTATGLLTTSFAATGMVDLVPALAVMLGANVGTTLIVQLLSFDIIAVAPVLFAIGLFAYRRGPRTRIRDLGRVAIGLGLMLLALHLLVTTIGPSASAPAMVALFAAVAGDPVLALLIAAVLTWAVHSSVAVVLLVLSLADIGAVTPIQAFALVLGANLGSAINPVLEGGHVGDPASRRLPVGNLVNRLAGCLVLLPVLQAVADLLPGLDSDPGRQIANFHTAFNLATALVFLPLLDPMARLLRMLLPERLRSEDPTTPRYLDPAALKFPSVALANATRETLRIADRIKTMLQGSLHVFRTGDRQQVAAISEMDDAVDKLHTAVKLYLARLPEEEFDDDDRRRYAAILAFAINLEHIGDIIDLSLMDLAEKMIKRRITFSADAMAEIETMLTRLITNLDLATAVLIAGDAKSAKQLVREKEIFRDLERTATENHFARLRDGRPEAVAAGPVHLDILRDARRINAHIAATVYPLLEEAGVLRRSRLVDEDDEAA